MAMVLVMSTVAAQDASQAIRENPNYGATPDERVENVKIYSFYRDAYNNKDYARALSLLPQLLEKAPRIGDNLYIFGMNMYRSRIESAASPQQRNTYIDSLMLLYDRRMEYFGDHPQRGRGYISTRKAYDYQNYKPADRAGVRKCCTDAIAFSGDALDPSFVVFYFNELVSDYKSSDVDAEFLLSEYERLSTLLESEPNPDKAEAKKSLDALFLTSGAADCDNLEKLFKPKFAANPADTVMLRQAMSLFIRNKCGSDFQMKIAEAYHKLMPSASTAMLLASSFEERKEYDKAKKYLLESFSAEKNGVSKANLAVRIAGTELARGDARGAADYARRAADINPQNGFAHMILAQAYALGASQCADFERQTVYWLVVDELYKARQMLSGDASQTRDIDSQIASYKGRFPTNEECFFRGLDNGAAYNVNCGWVSGRTTVRTR